MLHVVTNSLEFADISVVEDGIDDSINSSLNGLKVNGPEVFVDCLLDTPCGGDRWLSPCTEAFIRDDVGVGLIESLKESTINVFGKFSMSLNMVEFLGIVFRAVWSLFEKSHKWLFRVVASLDSYESSGNNLEHFFLFKLNYK